MELSISIRNPGRMAFPIRKVAGVSQSKWRVTKKKEDTTIK